MNMFYFSALCLTKICPWYLFFPTIKEVPVTIAIPQTTIDLFISDLPFLFICIKCKFGIIWIPNVKKTYSD